MTTDVRRASVVGLEIAVLDRDWVGREALISDLLTRLQNSCLIILLLGITGIGKTTLAESLVVKLRGNWSEYEKIVKISIELETLRLLSQDG